MNELITQILQECLRINQQTDRAAFFDFSGHVNKVEVRVCVSKTDYNNSMYWPSIWGDDNGSFEDADLANVLNELKSFV